MPKKKKRIRPTFGICIDNKGYPASLEMMKLYEIVSDAEAAAEGMLRVVDGTGESYLYRADRFVVIEASVEVEQAYEQAALA